MCNESRMLAVAAASLAGIVLMAGALGCGGQAEQPAAGGPLAVASENVWNRQGPYPCRRATGPIAIDQKQHAEQWAHAAVITDWIVPVTGKQASDQTQMRMLWDDECLYVYYVAYDRDLRGTFTKRDDPIYQEDVVELFLKPYADKPFYYEFEVNPIGTVMALEIPGVKEKAGLSLTDMSQWETGIRCAVKAAGTVNKPGDGDEYFQVVMAIPWKKMRHIGSAPKAGEVWRFNGARCNRSAGLPKEREFSAGAFLSRIDFHPTADYASLRFAD
ncbi:MAG: hypothetical protein AMK72_04850 [Planctomycetes bacterium SM23_25]|nr:MAG: hypothetical protein AMK72_04850 [Planctomycetes bacterium SM23_25]